MNGINKVILVGTLGRDPEQRYLPSGDSVTNFSIATSERWKDKATGEEKSATEWHRITVFAKLAEICGQYLRKGSKVYIEGKLQTRKWADKDGVDKYTTEIKADQMQMLGDKPQDGAVEARTERAAPQGKPAAKYAPAGVNAVTDYDDDIPF